MHSKHYPPVHDGHQQALPRQATAPPPVPSWSPDAYGMSHGAQGIPSSSSSPLPQPTGGSVYLVNPQQQSGRHPSSSTTRLHKQAPSQSLPPQPLGPPMTAPSMKEAKPSPRLSKMQRRRSSSVGIGFSNPSYGQAGLIPTQNTPPADPRVRSSSAQPPNNRISLGSETRITSGPPAVVASRPGSSNGSQSPTRDSERRGRLRRSWLPGSRSPSHSKDSSAKHGSHNAWVLGQDADYNTAILTNGDKVPELWNENGDVYVFLHPQEHGIGPSFKVPMFRINTSLTFSNLIGSDTVSMASSGRSRGRSFSGQNNLSAADATRMHSPPLGPVSAHGGEAMRLYLPSVASKHGASATDIERLVSMRNLFAFLTGQPLVATTNQSTLLKVFIEISNLLREYEFTSPDGTSFGEPVNMSFRYFMDQYLLDDVRHSREKTLEALVLGERMRSMELYKEAFAHGAGKYAAIRDLRSPLWDMLSPQTRQRLERAHLDLVSRQNSVNNRLEAFEFPALFSGIANSTAHTEYRDVRFASWRKSFNKMRQLVLGHYKVKFGSWPPKARSKKNPFSESGLNRQVLKILYSDCCALYDLMVDRKNVTTRAIDQSTDEDEGNITNPHISALRKVLAEFDHSSPPVLPPIPFDAPMLPDMSTIQANYHELPPKDQMRLDRSLQEYQRLLILNKTYDFEALKLRIPLLEEFKEFENKETKGKSVPEMMEQRLGYWLFLYVVIQSLPMLVIDAPGLHYTEGVEYFLCQPPKGHPPWVEDAPAVRKRWYEVAGGGGVVELSSDAVEFGIEGIYHRSHCWLAAKEWEVKGASAPPPSAGEALSPLPPPQSVFTDMDPAAPARSVSPQGAPPGVAARPRAGSPNDRHSAYRKSVVLGLEPINLPDSEPHSGGRIASAASPATNQWPSNPIGIRSQSSGNLPALPATNTPPIPGDSRGHSRQGSGANNGGGSTFDDILKGMEKPKKKKSSMFF